VTFLISADVLGSLTRQELWKNRMKKSSLLWIIVVVSGCVFTDLKEIPQQIGLVPTEDASTDSGASADLGASDASVDDLGLDGGALDVGNDVGVADLGPDSTLEDMGNDAEIDMSRVCWNAFRRPIPEGGFCAGVEPTAGCNIMTQQGCPTANTFCAPAPINGQLKPVCVGFNPDLCDYQLVGEVCAQKATTKRTCEPGAYCPLLKMGEDSTSCRWYCELATGKGCDADTKCTEILSTEGHALIGYGICEANVVCPG